MKTLHYLLSLCLLSSCTHTIVRQGYQISKSDYKNCDIAIKKYMMVPDSLLKLGEITLGESGFATACSEEHAIEILRKEGCAIHASLINIVEEKRPDLWSSCYRCRAVFYKLRNSNVTNVSNDPYYQRAEVSNRVEKDRARNTIIGICAGVLGFLIGYSLFK